MVRRVLVLGSSGFLGQHLYAELMGCGVEVTGYGRTIPSMQQNFIQGDFFCETRFEEILEKGCFDTVYHLISTTTPGTGNALREIEENLLPTVRLLDAMKRKGGEVIFASSGGTVYGESAGKPHRCDDPLRPICSYGVQKVAIESFMQLYNQAGDVRCKICRISNPYGIMPQHGRTQGIIPILLRCLLNGKPITLFGETVRDYIFISDVITALISVAGYRGQETVFNIGTGIGTGLHTLVALLEERAGRRFVSIEKDVRRDCDVLESVLDISNTTQLLGWTPQVTLEDGIDKTLKALHK